MLTVTVAVLLTGLRELTLSAATKNEDIFNKKAVLKSIQSKLGEDVDVDDYSDEKIMEIFDTQIAQYVVKTDGSEVPATEVKAEDIEMEKEVKKPVEEQQLPLYVYTNNADKYYIVTVRGSGLWDAIWGYIALEKDFVLGVKIWKDDVLCYLACFLFLLFTINSIFAYFFSLIPKLTVDRPELFCLLGGQLKPFAD